METRRLRLSVVAYLRGLLEPYYENGFRSLIRENMILKALSTELSAEALENSALIDASLVSVHKNASGLYSRMYDKVNEVKAMREHKKVPKKPKDDFFTSKENNRKNSRGLTSEQQNIVDTYKLLHEIGVMDALAQTIDK